jgi:hypothetical protein
VALSEEGEDALGAGAVPLENAEKRRRSVPGPNRTASMAGATTPASGVGFEKKQNVMNPEKRSRAPRLFTRRGVL